MVRCFAMALAVVLLSLRAEAQHFDILAARDVTGTKLVSGTADISNGAYTVGSRVFGADFGEDPSLPHLASDPGFNAVVNPAGGLALPGNIALNFDFKTITIGANVSNLYYWDGAGAVNFVPAPAGYAITASKAGGFSATADGSALDITGFNINTTSSTGFIHKHLDYEVTGNNGNPVDGVYLVSQQFRMNGLTNSDPYFLVFNHGMDEVIHDNAVSWAQTTLAPIPEPSAFLWAALFAGVALRKKSRLFTID
ncbi:hypothetical protein BH11PLA2_BH11PLA2_42310 [soil metagenome]